MAFALMFEELWRCSHFTSGVKDLEHFRIGAGLWRAGRNAGR
jgi:hypothetical protein